MNRLGVLQIDSLDRLIQRSAAWDELWARSAATLPSLQSPVLGPWIAQFAGRNRFRAIVITHDGHWVAALPLVGRRVTVLPAANLPNNPWANTGDLLLDPGAPVDEVCDRLVAAMAALGWPLWWLDEIEIESPRWLAFAAAAGRAGLPIEVKPRYPVARIATEGDWHAYRASLPKSHREKLSRGTRRLEARGTLELLRLTELAPDELEPWLRRGWTIEDQSWKGAAGSSVLRTPGMPDYFLRLARALAARGQLELDFLMLAGQPIAFAFAQVAKGVYHSCKLGYDPAWAQFSPGHVLRGRLLEQLFASPEIRMMDCYGPLTDAHKRWQPQAYQIGRVMVGSRTTGRWLLAAYRKSWRRPKQIEA